MALSISFLENYYTRGANSQLSSIDAVYYGFEVGNEISYNTYLEGLDDTVLSLSNSIYQTYGFEAGGTKNKSLDPEGEFIDSVYTLSTVVCLTILFTIRRGNITDDEISSFIFSSLQASRSSFWVR